MARLSLRRKQRRMKTNALIRAYWLEVISVISWFYNVVCTVIAKEMRHRPIRYSMSSIHKNLTLDGYIYESHSMYNKEAEESSDMYEAMDGTTISASSTVSEGCSGLRLKKKRARSQDLLLLEGITTATSLLRHEFEASFAKLSASIEYLMDTQRKTNMIILELSKMGSLSTRDVYKAVKKITSVRTNVLVFFSFKEEQREDWVRYLLEEDA